MSDPIDPEKGTFAAMAVLNAVELCLYRSGMLGVLHLPCNAVSSAEAPASIILVTPNILKLLSVP